MGAERRLAGTAVVRAGGRDRRALPGLATIGIEKDSQVLLDLPSVGMVGVAGRPGERDEVLSAMATEVATGALNSHVNVSAIGLGIASDLADLAKTGHVRSISTAHECLRELELLTLEYASGETAPEDIPPEILISADPLTTEHLGRLRTISGHAAAPLSPSSPPPKKTNPCPVPGSWMLPTASNKSFRYWGNTYVCSASAPRTMPSGPACCAPRRPR